MDRNYELEYHKLETTNYWWFECRRHTINTLLQQTDKNAKILEIGCSGGSLNIFLNRNGFKNLYGIDISEKAIELCKNKGIKNVFAIDAKKTNFNNDEFDIIIASDVLEHIYDDSAALVEWNRILRTNGKLLLFVPAFRFLWSDHDKRNKHYRRYHKSELQAILKKNGFSIERISYWNFTLFLPIFGLRIIQKFGIPIKLYLKPTDLEPDSFINKMLTHVLTLENYFISRQWNLPIGITLFYVCTKNHKEL